MPHAPGTPLVIGGVRNVSLCDCYSSARGAGGHPAQQKPPERVRQGKNEVRKRGGKETADQQGTTSYAVGNPAPERGRRQLHSGEGGHQNRNLQRGGAHRFGIERQERQNNAEPEHIDENCGKKDR
jgi:hypothetical protein